MDTIQQLEDNKKIAILWYGQCGVDCEDYVLADNTEQADKIDHIYEIADDETQTIFYSSYSSHIHGNQDLTTLQCGHAYYVVLKKGNDTLEIPNVTIANAGISDAGKVSPDCVLKPDLDFVTLEPNQPHDLKLRLTVDITDLIAPCAANSWKYMIYTGGEEETDDYDGKTYGPYNGSNISNGGADGRLHAIVVSPKVDDTAGGLWYKVKIWGVDADGVRSTEEPDQELTTYLPWPGGSLQITGTVNVQYNEYEGPSSASSAQSFSGNSALVKSIYLVKPSMNSGGDDTNINRYQYSINNTNTWVDYDSVANDTSVQLNFSDKIYWRLKSDISAGAEATDSTSYNSKMTIKYIDQLDTVYYVESNLSGKVYNQRITITSLTDNRNNTTTLKVNLFTASKFKYKLEKLTAQNGTVEKTYTDYGTTLSSTTQTINTLTMIQDAEFGPGWYQVTAQAWNNSRKVSDVDAVEKTYINWATATLSATNSVSDSYAENAGPSEGLPITVSASWIDENSVEFNGQADSKWEYQIGTGAWTALTDTKVNLSMSAVSGNQSSLNTFKVRMKAGLTEASYNEQINWFATGKDTTSPTDTTTLNGTVSEPVVGPKVAWIGFQDGTNSTYSNWYKLDVIDNEFIDLTEAVADWNSKSNLAGFMSQMTGISGNCAGKSFDFALKENVQLDSCKHRGDAGGFGIQDPIGEAINPSLASAADSDSAWNSLNGKSLAEVGGRLGVYVPTSYTKMKISESETSYATELSTLANSSDGDDVAYFQGAMITASPERPEGVLTQDQLDNTFNSDGINVFCNGCPPESNGSGVNLRIDQDEDGTSNIKRYNATSCSHAGMTSGNWNGANLYFRSTASASNGSLRRLGDESKPIKINEIYFDMASDDTKIKLVNGKLPDCA